MPKRTRTIAHAREILAQKRAPKDGIGRWLREHPEAEEFVKAWLEMRRDGESDWGSRRVVEHLRREHGFPFSSDPALIACCRREWPLLAQEALGQ